MDFVVVESAHRNTSQTKRNGLQKDILSNMSCFDMSIPDAAVTVTMCGAFVTTRQDNVYGSMGDAGLPQCAFGELDSEITFSPEHQSVMMIIILIDAGTQAGDISRY